MIRLPPLGQGTQMPLTGYIKLPPLVGSQPSTPKPDLSFSSPVQTPPVNLLGGTETSTPVIAPGPTNFLKTAGKAILDVIKNPTQLFVGAGTGTISATLGVAQGLTNLVGANALSERIKQNKDYLNQVVRDNVAPGQDQKTAFTVGQFVGEQLPYILASEATAGIVNPITAEALSKTDITLKAASTIGKLTKAASNAAGFIGLDQITHTPEEGSRAQSVMKDLLVLGTLEGLGVGLGKLGDIKALKDTRAYLDTIKTEKPPLAEIEAKTTQLTAQIKTETGKSPQELIAQGVKNTPEIVQPKISAIPPELQPLAQEARKYKSAEEFVRNYDGGLILDREKVNNWIAGGPDNTVPVSEILGPEGKKFMKDNGLPDIPVRVQQAGEETIGHYAQIEWRGGNRLKDARINIEISPTEEFGVENLLGKEKDLLHELSHAKQIMLNRLGNKKIQGAISENAAEKHANYILSKTKSQLTDFYNQATKGVKEVPQLIESPKVQVTRTQLPVGTGEVKTSRLEARIKGKLDNLSEADRQNISTYNQMNKKDQITQAVKYVTENPEDAMRVLRGDKPAPKGLLNNSIFLAMEEHANVGNDSELSLKLASLRSTRMGQEIGILTERDPNSAVKYLSDIQTRRIEALGREKFNSLRTQELGNVKRAISIPRLQKTDWNAFIDSIRC